MLTLFYTNMTKQDIQNWCNTNGYDLVKKDELFKPLTEEQIIKEGTKGIISRVARMAEITQAQLLTHTKKEKYMFPRQIAQAVALKYLLTLSQREIGEDIGGMDRTTVRNSLKSVNRMMRTDKYYRYRYGHIVEIYNLMQ